MRVVHATSVHPAHDVRIAHKECRSAANNGHEVYLVACRGEDPKIPGVNVVFVDGWSSRLDRFLGAIPRVAEAVLQLDPDIIHIHDPEMLLAVRKLSKRVPVVFDMHEDIPAQVRTKHWIPQPLRRPVARLFPVAFRLAAKRLSGVVYAVPHIIDNSCTVDGALVRNFPRLAEFSEYSDRPRPETGALTLSYIGIITRSRGSREMVEALGLLRPEIDATLHLCGPLRDDGLAEKIDAFGGSGRVNHTEWLNRSQVADLLSRTDIGLAVLHPEPNYVYSYPTKMFEYMAAGCAVIGSDLPIIRQIIEESGCGVVIEPGDPEAMAAAIADLALHRERLIEYGIAGRRAVEDRYNWELEEKALLDLYDRIELRQA